MYCITRSIFLQHKYGRPFGIIWIILYYDSIGDRCHNISDEDIISRKFVITMIGYFYIATLNKMQYPQ